MPHYVFRIVVGGSGKSPEEAWQDAAETIRARLEEFLDPDDVPEFEVDDSMLDDD